MQVRLAQAMIATRNPKYTDASIRHLRRSLVVEKSPLAYRLLASAYGRKKRIADADLAMAHSHFHSGRWTEAQRFAKRAQNKFPSGSAKWVQADDIIRYTKRNSQRRYTGDDIRPDQMN